MAHWCFDGSVQTVKALSSSRVTHAELEIARALGRARLGGGYRNFVEVLANLRLLATTLASREYDIPLLDYRLKQASTGLRGLLILFGIEANGERDDD